MKNCLYCYLPLDNDKWGFHQACSKKFFGQNEPPDLPYDESNMEELAGRLIHQQTTLTGVQPKISLNLALSDLKSEPKKFTIVGLWGDYILKPPTPHYTQLPEVEDTTMHLASIAGIRVVPHCLIRLKSGNLAYITRRIDRTKSGKLAMEDMCQLTERLTEEKYHGSYEQVGKALLKYSSNPILDLVNYFELLVFSFVTGNSDMHLKNFSLIEKQGNGFMLAPAYDLIATTLVNPEDNEEMALTLNGKKNKINRSDFESVFRSFGADSKQQSNIFGKMEKAKTAWINFIGQSFLSKQFQDQYIDIIQERMNRLS